MIVRFRTNRKGKPWELDCGYAWVEDPVKGRRRKRDQTYFRTKKEAEGELDVRRRKVKEFGRSAVSLSEGERVRFVGIARRLEGLGVSLESCVDFYERHHVKLAAVVSVAELVRRALQAKEGRLRDGSLSQLRVSWGAFMRGREERRVGELSAAEVSGWLRSGGWSIRTQRNYLSDLRNLFGWARSAGVRLADKDPTEGVRVEGREDEVEVSCMTPAQAGRLLEVARASFPDFLGYVALGLFAGMRSVELERSSMADMDLKQGVIVVAPWQTRTRTRRPVSLTKNALEWLRLWRSRCPELTQVLPRNFEERWGALRVEAGWKLPWPKNVARHTAASMHFAMWEDEKALKKWLGHHKSEDTLFRNYRAVKMLDGGIISKGVAREFWGICPGPDGPMPLRGTRKKMK